MANSYKILRTNPVEKTVTVLLNSNGHELQQDIEVTDFNDVEGLKKSIYGHLGKLESDLASLVKPDIPKDLKDLIGGEPVEVSSKDISENPLPEPETKSDSENNIESE